MIKKNNSLKLFMKLFVFMFIILLVMSKLVFSFSLDDFSNDESEDEPGIWDTYDQTDNYANDENEDEPGIWDTYDQIDNYANDENEDEPGIWDTYNPCIVSCGIYTYTETRSCGYNNIGICKLGTQTRTCTQSFCEYSAGCDNPGTHYYDTSCDPWSECQGAVYPQTEVCNGLDDDCDGQVDEGHVCNHDPIITSQPNLNAFRNELYQYQVIANDPDNDELNYSLEVAPQGMTINANGLIQWIPNINALGNFNVKVIVRDGFGGEAVQEFTINVVNRKPIINSTPELNAYTYIPYIYNIMAYDEDGDILIYKLLEAPDNMQLNNNSIYWIPTRDDLGLNHVVIEVDDGNNGITQQAFDINVNFHNRLPVLVQKPSEQTNTLEDYVSYIKYEDPDNDTLSYQLITAPLGMTIDNNGTIKWFPYIDQVGNHTVVIQVYDGFNFTYYNYTLSVVFVNHAPQFLGGDNDYNAYDGKQYTITFLYMDIDNQKLTLNQIELPHNAQYTDTFSYGFGSSHRIPVGFLYITINWTPQQEDVGLNHFTFVVCDENNSCVNNTIDILVHDVEYPPELNYNKSFIKYLGDKFEYRINATDHDHDVLNYFLTKKPEGMRIDTLTGEITWDINDEKYIGNNEIQGYVFDGTYKTYFRFNITVLDKALLYESRERLQLPDVYIDNYDDLQPGDTTMAIITLTNNDQYHKIKGLKITITNDDLDIWSRAGPFDILPGQTITKHVRIEIPYDAEPRTYTLRIRINNDQIKRIKHRDITIN